MKMDCETFRKASSDYAVASDALSADAREHLAACEVCAGLMRDGAGMRSAVRRAFGEQRAPDELVARLRGMLADESPGSSADAPADPTRSPLTFGMRLWGPLAAAAMLAIVATVAVWILTPEPSSGPKVTDQVLAADLVKVHLRCAAHDVAGDGLHGAAAAVDHNAPLTEQAAEIARQTSVPKAVCREEIRDFVLASCDDCNVDQRQTLHMIYARPGVAKRTMGDMLSLFAFPGSKRITDSELALELAEQDDVRIAGFSHCGVTYFLVARTSKEQMVALARDLMPRAAAADVPAPTLATLPRP